MKDVLLKNNNWSKRIPLLFFKEPACRRLGVDPLVNGFGVVISLFICVRAEVKHSFNYYESTLPHPHNINPY